MSIAADPLVPVTPASFPRLDRLLAWITELPAAALVLAEIVILGGGAFARYALHAGAHLERDAGMVAQSERDGGSMHTGLVGHVLQSRGLRHFLGKKLRFLRGKIPSL